MRNTEYSASPKFYKPVPKKYTQQCSKEGCAPQVELYSFAQPLKVTTADSLEMLASEAGIAWNQNWLFYITGGPTRLASSSSTSVIIVRLH
jgi:hypothetical protein